MPSLLATSLLLREWVQYARLERATAQPDVAQAAVLRGILRCNADTAFGRAHDFASIASPAEYARRVPIGDYEGFRPYVDRIVGCEERVLTREPVTMFTTTSGTTGAPKLIPVTASWRREMARLTRLWTFRAARDHPRAFARKALTIVSPAIEGTTATGMPFGAMSGVMYQDIPWPLRCRYAVPYGAYLIEDCEARYFVIMRLALTRMVSVIGAPNPTSLIRLAETAANRAEELIRAIHDGTLGVPSPAIHWEPGRPTAEPLRQVQASLRPDPARARALARLVARQGTLLPRDCWPDLVLIGCWLGGAAGIHARRLGEYYGSAVPRRDLGLVASEGRLTIPVEDDSPAGVPVVHANFYEFIPEDRIDDPAPSVRLVHELEDGHRYYVVLTSGNGLYRYDLNDIVEVRGFYRHTPCLAFVRKGREMVSITGEKLHLNHVQAAICEAEEVARLAVWQFRLIPDVEACRYDLLVELREDGVCDPRAQAFLGAFDRVLGRLNSEYASKRASKRLGPPRLRVMQPGWSERLCHADFARGQRELQHKWSAIRLEWDDASRAEVVQTVEVGGRLDCVP